MHCTYDTEQVMREAGGADRVFKYSASSPPADSVLPVGALARAGSAFDVLRNLWGSSPNSTSTAATSTTAAGATAAAAATRSAANGATAAGTTAGTDADADDLSLVIDEVVDSDAPQDESAAKRGAAALRGGASSSSSRKTAKTGLSLVAWSLAAVAAAVALLAGKAIMFMTLTLCLW
jgi:hypothetical protein